MAGTPQLSTGYAPPSSYGSAVVNGQLVGFQTKAGYYPMNYGGGLSAIPAASPVTMAPGAVGYGIGTAANNRSSSSASASDGTFVGSTAMWAIGLMAFGLLWLRFVHWRKPRASEPSGE